MPLTTLRLPPELKRRIHAVVKGTGQSVHAFMVHAIERETQLAEDRKNFVAAALDARDDFDRTDLGFRASDVHEHLEALAAGRATKRPRAIRRRR